jgi:hypothetical protein
MVSDAVALQYILNSPDFTYGATLETAVYMTFGKKSLMGAKGLFCSSSDVSDDQTMAHRRPQS